MAHFSGRKIFLVCSSAIFILMLIFACLYHVFFDKGSKYPSHKAKRDIISGLSVGISDFDFTEYTKTDNGVQKSFKLCGKKLQTKNPKIGIFRIAIGKIMELEKPRITFYKDNLPVSTASSNTGVINSLNKGITFFGNVGLITEEKRTLACNKLKWYNEQRYLLAEGNCILKSQNEVIKAEIIKTDIELKNFDVVSKNRGLLKTVTKTFLGGERR